MVQRTLLVLLTLLVVAISFEVASAASPSKPKPSKLPTIADFNKAMAAEQYADRSESPASSCRSAAGDRAAVSLAYGRILLGQGDKRGFVAYRKTMRTVASFSTRPRPTRY